MSAELTPLPDPTVEADALLEVEDAARDYARFSHGNLAGRKYHEREEARDRLLDALSRLDLARKIAA